MTILEVIRTIESHGFRVVMDDAGRPCLKGDPAKLKPELRRLLEEHRAAILAFLKEDPRARPVRGSRIPPFAKWRFSLMPADWDWHGSFVLPLSELFFANLEEAQKEFDRLKPLIPKSDCLLAECWDRYARAWALQLVMYGTAAPHLPECLCLVCQVRWRDRPDEGGE